MAGAEPGLWLYKDPSGKEQGPYPASQLLDWSEQGYFPISLQARGCSLQLYSQLLKAVRRFCSVSGWLLISNRHWGQS